MRVTLLLLLLPLLSGCMSARRVYLSLPTGVSFSSGFRGDAPTSAAPDFELQEALNIIDAAAHESGLETQPVKVPPHPGAVLVNLAEYHRENRHPSWLWPGEVTDSSYLTVLLNPDRHRLESHLWYSGDGRLHESLYRRIEAQLSARFGAERVTTSTW